MRQLPFGMSERPSHVFRITVYSSIFLMLVFFGGCSASVGRDNVVLANVDIPSNIREASLLINDSSAVIGFIMPESANKTDSILYRGPAVSRNSRAFPDEPGFIVLQPGRYHVGLTMSSSTKYCREVKFGDRIPNTLPEPPCSSARASYYWLDSLELVEMKPGKSYKFACTGKLVPGRIPEDRLYPKGSFMRCDVAEGDATVYLRKIQEAASP